MGQKQKPYLDGKAGTCTSALAQFNLLVSTPCSVVETIRLVGMEGEGEMGEEHGKDVGTAERRTGERVSGAWCWRHLQEQAMEV